MSYQGTQIIINLKNLKANLSFIKSKVDEETKIMSVVKAFGYGSGPVKISKFLEKNGVDYFAVAYVNEGIKLRNCGVKNVHMRIASPPVKHPCSTELILLLKKNY